MAEDGGLGIRAIVRNALIGLLAKRRLAVVPHNRAESGAPFLDALYRKMGIDLVLDVGANDGITGREFRAAGYAGRIVSFEPQAAVFEQLRQSAHGDPNWECRRLALGENASVVSMEVSAASVSSSLLPMDTNHVEHWPDSKPAGREEVPLARLDDLAQELGLSRHRTLLKMDVQGYELSVLRGARESLKVIDAVFAEILYEPLYVGQTKYFEVMRELDEAGFRFVGLFDSYYDASSPFPVFANVLFVRRSKLINGARR